MRPHIAYTHNEPCTTLVWHFCDDLGQFALKDDTFCTHLRCLIPFYNTLQCSLSLLQPFLTFSDAFRPFATFLDFALFNTPQVCITFSGTFHQTLFTWLVHHSFGFLAIISVQLALRFADISHFILLLQLYLWFLLPLLPKRRESSPFDRTTLYWPQISLCLSSLLFSLAFLVYRTDRCRLFFGTSSHCLYAPSAYLNDTFWPFSGPLSSYLHTHSPPFPLQETVYPLLTL